MSKSYTLDAAWVFTFVKTITKTKQQERIIVIKDISLSFILIDYSHFLLGLGPTSRINVLRMDDDIMKNLNLWIENDPSQKVKFPEKMTHRR